MGLINMHSDWSISPVIILYYIVWILALASWDDKICKLFRIVKVLSDTIWLQQWL